MIHRDENGKIISVDSLKDITETAKSVREQISSVLDGDISDFEKVKAGFAEKTKELQDLMEFATPELKDKAGAIEKLNFVKELLKMKSAADELQKLTDKSENNDD
ncbi:MAG: hypothetical protein PUB20_04035 [Clostridia bacterium]|nr:hypothetical protein [Clostridia bacterium]